MLTKWLGGVAIAVFLGFIAARQEQLLDGLRQILGESPELKSAPQPGSQPTPSLRAPAAAAPDFTMSIEGAAIQGNADAILTLIEFSDFECPFCRRYMRDSFPQIERDYVKTGKLRYIFRHFPLLGLHPHAMMAAESAECARLQGKFWPLHDRLFADQRSLEPAALLDHARAVGLDMKSFGTCVNGHSESVVRADLDAGSRAGVGGTPTFFFGFVQKDGSVRVIEKLVGARPYATFQSVLDNLLALSGATTNDLP